jgi:hypothetical protein
MVALSGLLLGVTALGTTTAGATARRVRGVACGPSSARTLAADHSARIYANDGHVFGCARAGKQSFRLGTESLSHSTSEGRVGPIALARTDVAYGLTYFGVDTISAEVTVRRLTDGHVVRSHGAITGSAGAEFAETVDAIVVKRDGSVAWIAHVRSIPGGNNTATTEVEKSDRTSHTLLQKAPSGIKLHSLRLAGSHLTWAYKSTTRSANLR